MYAPGAAVILLITLPFLYSSIGKNGNPGPTSNPDNVTLSTLHGRNLTLVSTGQITGIRTDEIPLTYNAGISVANNSTITGSAGSSDGIPITALAWISEATTPNLTADGGYIQYEALKISFMSS